MHLQDIYILKSHHLHLLRDIVSKICYCRTELSQSIRHRIRSKCTRCHSFLLAKLHLLKLTYKPDFSREKNKHFRSGYFANVHTYASTAPELLRNFKHFAFRKHTGVKRGSQVLYPLSGVYNFHPKLSLMARVEGDTSREKSLAAFFIPICKTILFEPKAILNRYFTATND